MAEINDIKDYVLALPIKEKDKLLLKLLKKNKEEIDRIYLSEIADESALDVYFEEVKEEIHQYLVHEVFNRGNFHKNMARGIGKANKAIKSCASVVKKPEKEAELLMYILDIIFTDFSDELGTCWTTFDHKVAQTLSRAVTMASKKIHPDYRIEFEETLNNYLMRLKKTSSHLDYIYRMPDRISYTE